MEHGGVVRGVLVSLLFLGGLAHAQVSCDDPDNLCTGDPCVIPTLEVLSPCVVDFRPRQLVIAGVVRAPGDAQVELTAASILVEGRLVHSDRFTSGFVSLAAEGNIDLDGGITVNGYGELTLQAGGNISLSGPVRGSSGPATMSITVDAGGSTTVGQTIRNEGPIVVRGASGVTVSRPLKTVLGYPIEVSSSGGAIVLDANLSANGPAGGAVTVDAQGDVTVQRNILARGTRYGGGSVDVASAAGNVEVNGLISVRGGSFYGVNITAPGSITLRGALDLHRNGDLLVQGGSVTAETTSSAEADGTVGCAGELRFEATAGDLVLSGHYSARAPEPMASCGVIQGTATGNIVANGTFLAAPSGCIGFSAGGTVDTSGGTFDMPVQTNC